jgi:polysaccharide export outer membrane protein
MAPLRAKSDALATVSAPSNAAYKIGPQDVLDISVFKVEELSKSVQVSEAGTINFPLVGEVSVAGMTPRDIEKELTSRLRAKYLQRPQVSIFVKEFNSQHITIEGAVQNPGVFPMKGDTTLLQAVAMARGLDSASDETVLVFRTIDGKRAAARFDIADIRTGSADDPQLNAGDVIVAGKSAIKEGFGNVLKVLPIASVFAFL